MTGRGLGSNFGGNASRHLLVAISIVDKAPNRK